MSVFHMVLGIVFLGVVAGMFKHYIDYKTRFDLNKYKFDGKVFSEELDDQKETIRKLEKRIQALESIITSRDFELDQKFKVL